MTARHVPTEHTHSKGVTSSAQSPLIGGPGATACPLRATDVDTEASRCQSQIDNLSTSAVTKKVVRSWQRVKFDYSDNSESAPLTPH